MNRWQWTALIASLVALLITLVVFAPDTAERETARLHRQIEADLPPGTPSAEVEAWLTSRNIEHAFGPGPTRTIWAQLYREYFWSWNGELIITFKFD